MKKYGGKGGQSIDCPEYIFRIHGMVQLHILLKEKKNIIIIEFAILLNLNNLLYI